MPCDEDRQDRCSALHNTTLFGELNETELQALAEHAVERHLARDEILFLAGDEAQGLFVVVSGALRAFREGVDGRKQVIHVERAGATIAALPVFDDKPYSPTVAAGAQSWPGRACGGQDAGHLPAARHRFRVAALAGLALCLASAARFDWRGVAGFQWAARLAIGRAVAEQ